MLHFRSFLKTNYKKQIKSLIVQGYLLHSHLASFHNSQQILAHFRLHCPSPTSTMSLKYLVLAAVLFCSIQELAAFGLNKIAPSVTCRISRTCLSAKSPLTAPVSPIQFSTISAHDGWTESNSRLSAMSADALPAETPKTPPPTAFKMVARKTVKKLLPLGLMLFFILFNYTILRDTKDVLVVTAPNSGAEIIPFLKTYVNLPSAIGFTVLYSTLCNKMSPDKVFYVVMTAFLTFFGAFAGFICECSTYFFFSLIHDIRNRFTIRLIVTFAIFTTDPNRMFLHPNAAADWLTTILPVFFLVSIDGRKGFNHVT